MITQEEIQNVFIPILDITYKSAGIKAEQIVGQAKLILARESKPEPKAPKKKKKVGDK